MNHGGDSIALKNRPSFRLSFKRKLKRFFKQISITAFLQFIHMPLENETLKQFFKRIFKRKFMQLNCHPHSQIWQLHLESGNRAKCQHWFGASSVKNVIWHFALQPCYFHLQLGFLWNFQYDVMSIELGAFAFNTHSESSTSA